MKLHYSSVNNLKKAPDSSQSQQQAQHETFSQAENISIV